MMRSYLGLKLPNMSSLNSEYFESLLGSTMLFFTDEETELPTKSKWWLYSFVRHAGVELRIHKGRL